MVKYQYYDNNKNHKSSIQCKNKFKFLLKHFSLKNKYSFNPLMPIVHQSIHKYKSFFSSLCSAYKSLATIYTVSIFIQMREIPVNLHTVASIYATVNVLRIRHAETLVI